MKKILIYSFLLVVTGVFAQQKDNLLPDANKAFAAKDFTDAEVKYRLSQSKNRENVIAPYNLGNAIYKMKQPAEAGFAYIKAIENAKSRSEKHRAFHNLGNVMMKEKNYTAAVEAYKNALINNPDDDETRYNFALAKKFLKENPPKKDDKKDKDKDKKQDDKSDDKANPKDDPKKDPKGDKKDDPNKQQPKPQPGISKQRVENLLNAVNNEEKKVQDKVKARQKSGKPVQTEKDW